MKKIMFSIAFAGSLMLATTACNSSKNLAGSSDSTLMDSATVKKPADTSKTTMPPDTAKTMPPDTTKKMPPM